ncbi:MAG: 23S rRNA (adenine(2503)-C(2))-methyltransferase RlmN [Bacteroidota bacterium]|nr:23S rRNA (adenine(2503)-C(2))-methyltransferase RlmN [Bacteroidota bacterium]
MSGVKKNLNGLPLQQLETFVASVGEPTYRAKQIFAWLYKHKATQFDAMTNLPESLRQKLNDIAFLEKPHIIKQQQSKEDGTIKLLLELSDGKRIESVLIPPRRSAVDSESRLTVCISTQVGCPLDCKFCATGTMGFERNLLPEEIIGQVSAAQTLTEKPITNIVFMGMGEPMLNYDNVMSVVEILTSENGMGFSPRRVTISTAGYVEQIKQMADEQRKVKLALSLHSLDNETRRTLMPITKKFSVDDVLEALEYYFKKTKKSVMLEYILFDGLNDSDADVQRLVKAVRRFECRVNLIPFHSIAFTHPHGFSASLKSAPQEKILSFASKLRRHHIPVFVRSSSGVDIDAACGQLAASSGYLSCI